MKTLIEREDALLVREKEADHREEVLLSQEVAMLARATQSALIESQLREVNESLVVASIRAQSMTEAAEQAAAKMLHMAEHDFLTGLPNRALLTDRLAQSILQAQRNDKKVALMYLDIDHFKHINDSLGHSIGDQLLQSAAKRLQSCVRLSDTVSRHGGDEFVVLLAGASEVKDVVLIAEKLIEVMAEPHFIGVHRLNITLSIGISIFPDDCKDTDTMVINADTAMYQAKKNGRNNFQVFTQEMNAQVVTRQSVEQALHLAIERGEFLLHYQPKVNLLSGRITGAEALIRWQRAGHELVYPSEFVSIAEDCGLILPIGRFVMREACRQTKEWLNSGFDLGQIAVNVSAQEFQSKSFLASVLTTLKETGLDPIHLEIELTESGLMQDTATMLTLLQSLKDVGIQLAVDDFGTGYSSLSYLQRFPIDTLKIDQSFVQSIQSDAGEAIVNAVIAMGASLKQRVVAEGIETKDQLEILQSCSCAEGQGFLYSPPIGPKEFTKLLIRN
jgi:diguanylate cyclase (GGDEF)-like protein